MFYSFLLVSILIQCIYDVVDNGNSSQWEGTLVLNSPPIQSKVHDCIDFRDIPLLTYIQLKLT